MMSPKETVQFRNELTDWFDAHHRKLPWRDTQNPYRIWVSEVMLQQTQVTKVLHYYQDFLDKFPDVQCLAQANLQDVLKAWEGLGYYARARNLHQAAKVIVSDFGGKIPADYGIFRNLPGVGDYIAAAVQSIAFHAPYAVVDGNVKRVVARLFLINSPINASSSSKTFQNMADMLLDRDSPGAFNQAMMELGATVCRPKSPLCVICPVKSVCCAFQSVRQEEFPIRLKPKPLPEFRLAVGVVRKNNRVLITQRKFDGLLGGMWEFPGDEIKGQETPEEACIRQVKEHVNLTVEVTEYLTRVKHAFTHFKIVADVFCCRYQSGEVALNGPVDHRWITVDEIDQFPFPRAHHQIIPSVKGNSA